MNIGQVVVELPEYIKQIEGLMNGETRDAFIEYIALNPLSGTLIQGTGGARKIRWASVPGKGKSGGARVIYYYHSVDIPIFLLTAYGKGAKASLSATEKNVLKSLLRQIVQLY